MTPANKIVRIAAETAMQTYRLSQTGLASEIGCTQKTIAKILDELPVKLVQEQYIELLRLGGLLHWKESF